MAGTSRCRSCGAPIKWGITPLNRQIPIDAEPTAGGNVHLEDDGTAKVLSKEFAAETEAKLGVVLHKSHFATCPNSAQHRKPKPE